MPDVSVFNKPAPPSIPPLVLLPDPLLQCGWVGQAAMGESLNPSEQVGREAADVGVMPTERASRALAQIPLLGPLSLASSSGCISKQ